MYVDRNGNNGVNRNGNNKNDGAGYSNGEGTLFEELIRNSPDGIAVIGNSGILYINTAGAGMLGAKDPLELTGTPVASYMRDDFHRVIGILSERPLSSDPFVFDTVLSRIDGSTFDAEISVQLMRDEAMACLTIRDLGTRKAAEKNLILANDALRMLCNANQIINRSGSEIKMLQSLCGVIATQGYDVVWVGLTSQDLPKRLECVASAGAKKGGSAGKTAYSPSALSAHDPFGEALLSASPVVVTDLAADTKYVPGPWKSALIDRDLRSVAVFPLRTDGDVLGALVVHSSNAAAFRELTVNALAELSQDLGYGIATIRMRETRHETEEVLRATQERFRNTLDSMLEGCQIIGFDWRYLYLNDAVVKHSRYSKEDILGKKMTEVYPGIEQTQMFGLLKRCMEDRVPQYTENEFTFPDGSRGWFDLSIQPVDEGIFILSIETTHRKRSELSTTRRMANLSALRSIDIAIASSLDLDLTLHIALEQVAGRLEVAAADVLLFNPETLFFECTAQRGFSTEAIRHSRARLGEDSVGLDLLGHKTVHIPDLGSSDPHFKRADIFLKEGFVSYYAVPLITKGEIKGILEVAETHQVEHDEEWESFLETLAGQIAIAVDSGQMFRRVQRSNMDLILAYDATIEGWSRALDLRDKETEGHTLRVTAMAELLARKMSFSESEILQIRRGALLHDIGKMGVPDHILLKPEALSVDEWSVMKKHPEFARDLLSPIRYLEPALDIPYCHHEKWDGTGYPRGLKTESIPIAARVFAVVDVWDALRSDRPYRPGWSYDKTRNHIGDSAGTHLDPLVVEHFLRLIQQGDSQFRTLARV